MQTQADDSTIRLAILRQSDRFRDWHSLDDKRVCVVCGRQFSGQEVRVRQVGELFEVHCPTRKCESGVHEWVILDNPLLSEVVFADWWRALGEQDHATATAGNL